MRKLKSILFFFLIFCTCFSYAEKINLPAPTGYINDYVSILSPEVKNGLENFLSALDAKTTAQVAVVIIDTTQPYDLELYAVKLFETWGIGQKEKHNGVLLLISLKDRKIRIEVGYGLEGVLNDAKCGRIIRDIIAPYFRNNQFDNGISAAIEAIVSEILNEYNLKTSDLQTTYTPQFTYNKNNEYYKYKRIKFHPINQILFIIIGIIFLILLITNPTLLFALLFAGRVRGGWYNGGWGGGSGGFGGGFGGFGGGMSGGGGASGGW